jgi:hypothetical protein
MQCFLKPAIPLSTRYRLSMPELLSGQYAIATIGNSQYLISGRTWWAAGWKQRSCGKGDKDIRTASSWSALDSGLECRSSMTSVRGYNRHSGHEREPGYRGIEACYPVSRLVEIGNKERSSLLPLPLDLLGDQH